MPHDKPKNYREIRRFGSYIRTKAKRKKKVNDEPKQKRDYSGNPLGKRKIKGRFSKALVRREPYHPQRVYSEPTQAKINQKPTPQVYSESTQAHIHSQETRAEIYSRPTNPEMTRRETKS